MVESHFQPVVALTPKKKRTTRKKKLPGQMRCPKCGKFDVIIKRVPRLEDDEKNKKNKKEQKEYVRKHHSFFWWLTIGWWWNFIGETLMFLTWLPRKIFRRIKTESMEHQMQQNMQTICYCQSCKFQWDV